MADIVLIPLVLASPGGIGLCNDDNLHWRH